MKRTFALGAPVLLMVLAASLRPAAADGQAGPDRPRLKRAAGKVDALVDQALRKAGLKPGPLADDATFVRRTYLALVGRIPTPAELDDYASSLASEKALRLVDELIESKGHESHLFNWWSDLLRVRSRLPRRISGEPYVHWLKQALSENKPYDRMIRELLTASGPVHRRGNGATGYLMRDRNMPEDNMSNTIRVFLGTRVECAQCHNHPFDKWTQRQYFEMVAFTGGIRYQINPRTDERTRRLSREAQQKWGRNGVRALRRTMEPFFTGIYGSGSGAVRLPKDYQYDDAEPNDWVTAHAVFAPAATVDVALPSEEELRKRVRGRRNRERRIQRMLKRMRPGDADTRTSFADWMTSRENDRFATVIANRVWKRVMGRGLLEPVDDLRDDSAAAVPELMEHLTRLVVELDFDLRAFERVLLYTRLWRRQAVVPAAASGTLADLRGPLLRRMTAEQAWDSLLTLVVDGLDKTIDAPLGPRAERVYAEFDELGEASDAAILERAGDLAERYANPSAYRERRAKERAEERREMQRKRRDARPLYRELNRARRAGDEAKVAEIAARLREMGLEPPGARAGRAVRDLQRASDLPSPAPDGHLLREMGQSDRDLIEASHTDPTVPQVLALLNAFLEQRLLTNRNAVLMRTLGQARPKAAVRTAFVAVLGRTPTNAERAPWEREVARGGATAVQDLVWTLVNTHEFLFIQ